MTPKKTILHLTHTCVPQDNRILRELNALGRTPGVELHAFGVAEGDTPRSVLASVDEDGREGTVRPFRLRQVPVWSYRAGRLPRPVRYVLALLEVNARFLVGMLRLRPGIVHCHDTMVLPAGVLAKILCKSTVVYDAHELESDKGGQSRALSKATLLIERASWPRIDRLITVSPSIADWYADNLGPKPTACILNSPEVHLYRTGAGEGDVGGVRDRLAVGTDVPLFLYVGALESGRGIELVLDAFTKPGADAHVAFIGAGGLQGSIERASDLHHNIHHCPPVPHDQLVTFIKDATGGFCLIEDVSLSDHYCLPNKLFEYAFAGLPIIASRLPDIESFVSQYQLGVCADLTVESVQEAVRECTAAPRDLPMERLSDLSWERQAEELRGLYRELDRAGELATAKMRVGSGDAVR